MTTPTTTDWMIVAEIGGTVWAPRVASRIAAQSKADHLNTTTTFEDPTDRWIVVPAPPKGRS